MGFTILNYSLQGLQPQSFYVSIQGNFMINKSIGPVGSSAGLNMPGLTLQYYSITFTIYYAVAKNTPVITQKQMIYNIQELPEPADIYTVIYDHIKKTINHDNIYSCTDE